ncbi:MAG: HTH-type transcriptional regulator ZntR [Deltaproteobacteria bacterium ADurb.Bin510]|nr:MAG: HTH-type transcriptional regulator ZntR [Deltaproteobacteria bacterium ADurb.Bin510]
MPQGFKIGELTKLTGCPVETIRYYEKQGLLAEPRRTAGGYRAYTRADVERLNFIRNCRALDMSLDEIRSLLNLRDQPQAGCDEVNVVLDEHIEHVAQRLRELTELHAALKELRSQCSGSCKSAQCGVLKGLVAVESKPLNNIRHGGLKRTHS